MKNSGNRNQHLESTDEEDRKILRIGIDLLWVRPKQVGGTESYIRNLLDGFAKYASQEFRFILFVSKENCDSFRPFFENEKFEKAMCNIRSSNVGKRIVWENLFLDSYAKNLNIDVMFIPVYSMPFKRSKIPYVVTIHDIQAIHFPHYFTWFKNFWLRLSWKNTLKNASKIVAISNFVKQDLLQNFTVEKEKIEVVYNPISPATEFEDFSHLRDRWGIHQKEYFYTVSSLAPHKNTEVLIKALGEILKGKATGIPDKLVISGINGPQASYIKNLAEKLNLMGNVIFTGYVADSTRNSLYKNAFAFLFPSTFEGFGMPPIEAMMFGTPVITTKCASIPEVTGNRCFYVDNPYSEKEWLKIIKRLDTKRKRDEYFFPQYDTENASKSILALFSTIAGSGLKKK